MPIYEYECAKCHQVTEAMQKFSDRPLTKCPQCGGKLSKLMSMNSFQLKGGGWYVTDYANKKSEGHSAAKIDTAPKGEVPAPAKASEKTESPAAKPAKSKSETPAA
jgi:putative FmdB family regulatory protein